MCHGRENFKSIGRLEAASVADILGVIANLKAKLAYLLDLAEDAEMGAAIPCEGRRERRFVEAALQVAEQSRGQLPDNFNAKSFAECVYLFRQLAQIQANLQPLNEAIDQCVGQLRGRAYVQSLEIYTHIGRCGDMQALQSLIWDGKSQASVRADSV